MSALIEFRQVCKTYQMGDTTVQMCIRDSPVSANQRYTSGADKIRSLYLRAADTNRKCS